jgi:hypothetical protein
MLTLAGLYTGNNFHAAELRMFDENKNIILFKFDIESWWFFG